MASTSTSSSPSPNYESFRVLSVLNQIGWKSVSEVPLYNQKGVKNDINNFPYLEIAFVMSLFIFVFEKYLSHRQLRRYRSVNRDDDVPEDVKAVDEKGEISKEKFQKSVTYGIDKCIFSHLQANISFVRSWLYFCLGFYPYIWDVSENIVLRYLPGRYVRDHDILCVVYDM